MSFMKYLTKIPVCAVAALLLCLSCSEDTTEYGFSLDTTGIEIGPDGGDKNIKITSTGQWQATTDATWIQFSPSNGVGPTECRIQIDSSILADEVRSAVVQVISEDQIKPLSFKVSQEGYKKFLSLEEGDIDLPNYGEYGKRTFDVDVTTNVPFEIKIDDTKPWVLCKEIDIAAHLNRGSRPRTIKLHFTWENNTRPEERDIQVEFVTEEELTQHDVLTIKQMAAEKIEPGIKGDSMAILACQRSLSCRAFDSSERMANWEGVVLWEETDKEVAANPELLGRVRMVIFNLSLTKEGIPFEIQYLTALEELRIFSLSNKFFYSFSTGPYLSKLTQLKRLQIYSFAITELDPSFKELKNLEALDLSGNNLDHIPAMLTPANFPKLTYLNLTGNRRRTAWDLNTSVLPRTDWAGLNKATAPYNNNSLIELFKWEKLTFLRLSSNYLQFSLPDMKRAGLPTYKADDEYWYWDPVQQDSVWHTIPARLVGTPKVLPNASMFSVNLNYMTGVVPDWILYHPHFMKWDPYVLIFKQETGLHNEKGEPVGFSNIPESPEYYYKVYPEQRFEEVE